MDYNQAWLSYNPVTHYTDKALVSKINIVKNDASGEITKNIAKEFASAFKKILSVDVEVNEIEASKINEVSGIVVVQGTEDMADYLAGATLVEQGYSLQQVGDKLFVIGYDENGILYGSYDVIRHVALNKALTGVHKVENPKNRFRMLNHWDNLEGDIERGYSGNSFFFENDVILVNQRTVDYARMVASVGINAVVINNVNVRGEAASSLIMDRYLEKVKEIADIFAGYGIKLYVSANFASPLEFGGLSTADPLDEGVAIWWKECVANLYSKIPHFGGFLIKADSEGRPGPFTYNRTHADGANVLARALKPYGGTLIWRCFVYNCQQDWRDYKTDRARAAYDHFTPLDGSFDENVILQIKNGPMDFQVREPISPLFGSLKKTNMMLEVQIAQEYTGQQKHVCYLIPMFKEILAFNTNATEGPSTVADIVSGRTYNQVNCGIAAVTNTGNDYNWTGHDLAGANLYGYSRLIWNTDLTAEEIAQEWVKQVFPHDEKVEKVLMDILMGSWPTYEKYTSPLGIGWMVNPNHHYGVNVDGYEYDKWGTYHRADCNGLGVDRTLNGTGYASQYNEPIASMYENKETCPEELLLFFHYVRYDYVLKTGKTLIQHIYDTHFEGVEELEAYIEGWKSLKDSIPTDIYERVSARFKVQLEGAIEWRDRVNTYFYRKSGVDDVKGRKIYG